MDLPDKALKFTLAYSLQRAVKMLRGFPPLFANVRGPE